MQHENLQQAQALVGALSAAIGAEQVRFDTLTRLLYSTDASNYQIMPLGVTTPRHADEVVAIHEIAAQFGVPVLPRGGGSSLAGQAVGAAVVIDFSPHMRRILSINADERRVTVEAGITLGVLNAQLAPLGLTFGPDPASAERATIGGCIGNNATGAHSIVYGMTADHLTRLQVVLPNGEKCWLDENTSTLNHIRARVSDITRTYAAQIAARYPKTWRTCAGYALNKIAPAAVNLNWLLAGSEGTLATLTAVELNLVPRYTPQQKLLAVLEFDTLRASLAATPHILELQPHAIELMDKFLLDKTRVHPEYAPMLTFVSGDPAAVLAVEFIPESDSHRRAQVEALRACLRRLGHSGEMFIAESAQQQASVWGVRKAGLGLIMSERSEAKPIAFIEDAAVPVEHLADYIQEVDDIIRREGTTYSIYAHASAGCLHVRPLVNLKTLRGREQYRSIGDQVAQAVMKYQGTLTGEHGKGIARGEYQRLMFGDALMSAFDEVKAAFDPTRMMNPDKMSAAPRMDDPAVLRYTPDYAVIPLKTRFDWQPDNGLGGAVEMCNGAGVCRKETGGTMCPSYRATRDEAHSTRGRANALRAAISGKLPEGIRSEALHGVFDLCLSCKACKRECPSSVDVAMLKAEFLASYHDAHGVPLSARVFGNIHHFNRVAGLMPRLANWGLNHPLGKAALRRFGIPTERPLPRYAPRPYRIPRQAPPNPAATLIVDSYAQYQEPHIVDAALKLADALGVVLRVMRLPAGTSGRTAISKGLLDAAKRDAAHNIRQLDPAHAPFLFLEPSELSAMIDDVPRLVDVSLQPRAQAIAAGCMSAEAWFSQQLAGERGQALQWDATPREIVLHGHCHQKALWGTQDSLNLLRCISGASVRELDTGCCGMAGSFGYEHNALSLKIANERLLPALAAAPVGTLTAASGTSCRAQIGDGGYRAQHPLEIAANALR